MSDWSGLLYLMGAVAGYAVFMYFQPWRATVGEGFGVAWSFPGVWLIAGVFESVRLTLASSVSLATGEVSPDEFLRVEPWHTLPDFVELLAPAGEAAMNSFLRMTTFLIDAWPLSVILAIGLLVNAGGALRHLWVAPRGGRRVTRWLFTSLAVLAALLHLAEVSMRWLPPEWFPELTPLYEQVRRAGSDLFTIGCGVAVQAWIILWAARSRAARFDGVAFAAALGRLVSLTPVIIAYFGLQRFYETFGDLGYGLYLMAGAVAAALLALPAQVWVIAGERGWIASLASHGTWVLRCAERVFWWLAVTGIHLFLLHFLASAIGVVIVELPWALWLWGVLFSFLKTGIYVWLLNAFIFLAAAPR